MAVADFAGFGVRGYRSFGDDEHIAIFGPMGKVHLIVGQNNVGKSNALHVMADVLGPMRQASGEYISRGSILGSGFDLPEGWNERTPRTFTLGLRLTDDVMAALSFGNDAVRLWLSTDAYTRGLTDTVWFDLFVEAVPNDPSNYRIRLSPDQVRAAQSEGIGFSEDTVRSVSNTIAGGSGDLEHNLQLILRLWSPWQFIPDTVWLDAVRQITPGGEENLRTGQGIIPRLAQLQRPARLNYARDRARFEALEAFVRDVIEDDQARIEIPDDKTTILIHGRFGMRELENVGTGLGELILLATVASINEHVLICIEEPEVHLHPTLQRKLIGYLERETSNGYLISTHSASMLNAELATITHIEMPDKWSVASPVITPGDLAKVASDLGNRASDVVQSNFVVWVEGPSDRLYVRKWLNLFDPELIEGGHYSVMFYGGALLSHLTADDEEVNDFINLIRINRNLALVIDSDKSNATQVLNATKLRVIAELETLGAPAWVTEGYTIENYLPKQALRDALLSVYPRQSYEIPAGAFKSPLGRTFRGSTSKPSKTSIARQVITQEMTWESLPTDLQDQITVIAQRIRQANGLTPVT